MVARRRRAFAVVAAVVLLLVALSYRQRTATPGPKTGPREGLQAISEPNRGDAPPRPSTPSAALPLPPTPPPAPDAPTVEVVRRRILSGLVATPPSPCVNEETLVEAVLAPGNEGAKVAIDGEPRGRAILVFGSAGPHVVRALADDWKAGWDEAALTVEVRDCASPPRVALALELRAGSELTARATLPGDDVRVTRWDWTFGDGTFGSTPGPVTTHSYALRPQRLPQETLVVEVRAQLAGGGERKGRATLMLVNEHLLTGLGDTLFLPVVHERYPRRDDEAITSSLQVRNLVDAPAQLDTATLRATPCARNGTPKTAGFPANALIDSTRLAADAVTAATFRLVDRELLDGTCALQVRLSGSAGGQPVQVLFSLELGAPESSTRVGDPALVRKVLAAQQLLGRSQVSMEEVQKLEAQGLLGGTEAP